MKTTKELVAEGQSVLDRARDEGRELSADERDRVRSLVSRAQENKLRESIDELAGGGTPARSVVSGALRAAGWDLGSGAFELPFGAVIIPDGGDAAPLRLPGIVPEGEDARRLYLALGPAQRLNGATRVDALVSTGRTLADPAEMALAMDATSQKPTTSSGATLEPFDVKMLASISDPYPNAIVGQPAFRDLVDLDMAVAYRDALDTYCADTLVTAATTLAEAGTDALEDLRKARTALEAAGYVPDVAAVSPDVAEAIDLQRGDVEKAFVLPPAPRRSATTPLWGMTVVTVGGLAVDGLVLDSRYVGLYLDPVTFDADPFTGFATNQTRFRYEGPACVVPRQPGAICVLGAS